jgi:catechol 2,3-dioxygenase-like lactoylglutathione lyase family enzyme
LLLALSSATVALKAYPQSANSSAASGTWMTRPPPNTNLIEGGIMSDPHDLPYPEQGLVLTHFLTVRDVARSRDFYADIFGGRVVLEENPAIVKVANGWIILNPGGGPTPDKPDVILAPPEPGDPISSFLNVRVADIAAFYSDAKSKGAQFLTEPLDRKAEIRCYLRDPDGYLIEIGQATGMLRGVYADRHAEDS